MNRRVTELDCLRAELSRYRPRTEAHVDPDQGWVVFLCSTWAREYAGPYFDNVMMDANLESVPDEAKLAMPIVWQPKPYMQPRRLEISWQAVFGGQANKENTYYFARDAVSSYGTGHLVNREMSKTTLVENLRRLYDVKPYWLPIGWKTYWMRASRLFFLSLACHGYLWNNGYTVSSSKEIYSGPFEMIANWVGGKNPRGNQGMTEKAIELALARRIHEVHEMFRDYPSGIWKIAEENAESQGWRAER